jgi:hypothetical protein
LNAISIREGAVEDVTNMLKNNNKLTQIPLTDHGLMTTIKSILFRVFD